MSSLVVKWLYGKWRRKGVRNEILKNRSNINIPTLCGVVSCGVMSTHRHCDIIPWTNDKMPQNMNILMLVEKILSMNGIHDGIYNQIRFLFPHGIIDNMFTHHRSNSSSRYPWQYFGWAFALTSSDNSPCPKHFRQTRPSTMDTCVPGRVLRSAPPYPSIISTD